MNYKYLRVHFRNLLSGHDRFIEGFVSIYTRRVMWNTFKSVSLSMFSINIKTLYLINISWVSVLIIYLSISDSHYLVTSLHLTIDKLNIFHLFVSFLTVFGFYKMECLWITFLVLYVLDIFKYVHFRCF